jgi:hypothetical protein
VSEKEVRARLFEIQVRRECSALADMLVEKNRLYGDSALRPLRCFSHANSVEQIRVRIDDKLSRITRGKLDMSSPAGEDVVLGLLGYLVLLRLATVRVRSVPAPATHVDEAACEEMGQPDQREERDVLIDAPAGDPRRGGGRNGVEEAVHEMIFLDDDGWEELPLDEALQCAKLIEGGSSRYINAVRHLRSVVVALLRRPVEEAKQMERDTVQAAMIEGWSAEEIHALNKALDRENLPHTAHVVGARFGHPTARQPELADRLIRRMRSLLGWQCPPGGETELEVIDADFEHLTGQAWKGEPPEPRPVGREHLPTSYELDRAESIAQRLREERDAARTDHANTVSLLKRERALADERVSELERTSERAVVSEKMLDQIRSPDFWADELARHDTLCLDSIEDRATLAGYLVVAVGRAIGRSTE